MKTVWMYFETDGNSGYYHIKLFSNKAKAEAYRKQRHSAYGDIEQTEIQ